MADSAFRERSQGLLTITVPVREAPRSSELHTQRRLLGAFSPRHRLRQPARPRCAPVVQLASDPLLGDLDHAPARRGHVGREPARDPRARGVGQDPGPDPSHRVACRARARPNRGTCSPSRSRARPPASWSTGSAHSVSKAVTAGTFHALALAQLRQRAVEQHREPPTVLASKARLLALARGRGDGRAGRGTRVVTADLAAEIEWAKARMVGPDALRDAAAPTAAGRHTSARGEIADLYRRYEAREAQAARACDFDDLLRLCADAIERDPTFAADAALALPARLRRRVPGRDTAPTAAAAGLARGPSPTCASSATPRRRSTAFAGADATPLADFDGHFPGGEIVALDRNYRSTPQVVAVAEAVLGADGRRRTAAGPRGAARRPVTDDPRATPTTTPRRPRVAQGVGRRSRTACPGIASACCSGPTRSRRCSRPRSPRAASRAGYRPSGRFVERPAVRSLLDELREAERESRDAFAEQLGRSRHLPQTSPSTGTEPSRRVGCRRRARARSRRARRTAREHRDALLRARPRVPRGRPAARGPALAGFVAVARPRDSGARQRGGRRRRRPAHVPPRQGPRVAGRVRDRARSRPRADLVGDRNAGARRGAPAAPRRARPGRGRAARVVGAAAHGQRPARSRGNRARGSTPGSAHTPRPRRRRSTRRVASPARATRSPRDRHQRGRSHHEPGGRTPVDALALTGNHRRGAATGIRAPREVTMARTTLPLFPTDDGWPYPDGVDAWSTMSTTHEPDLDALELQRRPARVRRR